MSDKGGVIVYEAEHGKVFRIKFTDAAGRQVMETLGRADEGWTMWKARAECADRKSAVRREGLRKLERMPFDAFAREWLDEYPDAKGLKRSTRDSYRTIIERHLIPAFGSLSVDAIDAVHVERYIVAKRRAGLGPRTINRQLNLMHELYKSAVRRKLARENPVSDVDRPKEPRRRWRILTPVEISAVERALRELAEEADDDERRWREQARVIFLLAIDAGLRRGELLGRAGATSSSPTPRGRSSASVRRGYGLRSTRRSPRRASGRSRWTMPHLSPPRCSSIGAGRRSRVTMSGCSRHRRAPRSMSLATRRR
jgi:Phage integrase, N-terminal SAM-like domain